MKEQSLVSNSRPSQPSGCSIVLNTMSGKPMQQQNR
jgi:hypothetical protein